MVFTGCEHAERTRTTVGKPPQRGGCLLGTGDGRWLCLRLRRYLFSTRATEARPCRERSRILVFAIEKYKVLLSSILCTLHCKTCYC